MFLQWLITSVLDWLIALTQRCSNLLRRRPWHLIVPAPELQDDDAMIDLDLDEDEPVQSLQRVGLFPSQFPSEQKLRDMHTQGLVWSRLVPPGKRPTLLLAPEEFLEPPEHWRVTPRTDLWLLCWQQMTPVSSSPQILYTVLAQSEHAAARACWSRIASACQCGLPELLQYVWQVTSTLGRPPLLSGPCALVVCQAFERSPLAMAAAVPRLPSAGLLFDPLLRASPPDAWSCAGAKDVVVVSTGWTPSMSRRLAQTHEVRAGTVCLMCAQPGPREGCCDLCRQWAKQ